MNQLIIGTHYVNLNEPCYLLTEQNLQRPGDKGFRRYQIIVVVRNDKLVHLFHDMGPEKKFKCGQFRIPGGAVDSVTGKIYIEHTVSELRYIADQLRAAPIDASVTVTDILGEYRVALEQKLRKKVGAKSYGYGN